MLQGFRVKDKLYREVENRFSTRIPWSFCSGSGVIVQKTGVLQKSYEFRGPDIESASPRAVAVLSYRLNDAVRKLGDGWALYFEVQRYSSRDYPRGQFGNLAGYMVDAERSEAFRHYGRHFESSYYLTIVHLPEADNMGKARGLFVKEKRSSTAVLQKVSRDIEDFRRRCADLVDTLSGDITIEELGDDESLTYLHSSVSRNWHYVCSPGRLVFLDRLLADSRLEVASTLKLEDDYIPVVSVNDYPSETYPVILDGLNRMDLEYRWVTRFVCVDKERANKEIVNFQKKFLGARKSMAQQASEMANKETSQRINMGAVALEDEANQAQSQLAQDVIGFGYLTTNVMVWDRDLDRALEKSRAVKAVINAAGFTAHEETYNVFNAFLGMMPGHVYANQRRHFVSTGNTSHIVPLSAVWSGQSENLHLGELTGCRLPHLAASTGYGTPFFLSLNVGDVGHTLVTGPTGAGKSTLLQLLAVQWLKYPGSRVFIFDKDRSSRQLTMAAGGSYYEPGGEGEERMSFQPLIRS